MIAVSPRVVEMVADGPGLHIPDGFVSMPVALAGWAVTGVAVGLAARRAGRSLDERAVPLMGVMAAFIFAAQMMNFPVAGGTSGHLLGGALTAVLLGPSAAIVAMTAVVGLQAFLFQDGGIGALGVNVLNMGVLTVLSGYAVFRLGAAVAGRGRVGAVVAMFGAAWVSVEVATVATALQLASSNTSPLEVGLPALVGVHALIGLGEGLISAAALGFVLTTRPDLAARAGVASLVDGRVSTAGWRLVAAGAAIALVVAGASAWLASGAPDGLVRFALDQQFAEREQAPRFEGLPGYTVPGIGDERWSTALAGGIGVLVVGGVTLLAARAMRRRGEGAGDGGAVDGGREVSTGGVAGFVERYAARDSVLHRADARAKFVGAVAYILAVTTTREGDWLALALLLAPVVVLAGASRLGYGFVLRRTFLALPFVAAAVPLAFTRAGETVLTLPLVGWTASNEGLVAVASIMARSWVAVAIAALFVASTPPAELLRALRWLRVPRLLVSTLFFTYRYLFVIGEEAQRMLRARAARSASMPGWPSGGSVTWRAQVAGHMVGSLFVRSLERSERVYAAMQARGYSGEARFLDEPALPRTELAWAMLLVVYGVAVQMAVRSW